MGQELIAIWIFSVLVEAVTEYIKQIREDGRLNINVLITIAVSILATVAFNIDIFSTVGFEASFPYVGNLLSGIIVARSSNYVFELFERISGNFLKEE